MSHKTLDEQADLPSAKPYTGGYKRSAKQPRDISLLLSCQYQNPRNALLDTKLKATRGSSCKNSGSFPLRLLMTFKIFACNGDPEQAPHLSLCIYVHYARIFAKTTRVCRQAGLCCEHEAGLCFPDTGWSNQFRDHACGKTTLCR